MTPEQREKKNLADKARRLRIKAGLVPAIPARAIEAGGIVAPTAPNTVAAVLDAKHAAEAVAAPAPAAKRKPKAPPAPKAPKASGGKRAGAGAPVTTGVRMRVITFKGTQEHYDAFHAAGAGAWLRGVLDAGVALKHIKVPK